MPRTSTLECPGCPPIRALTFDVLGLVKVTEARSKEGGIPKVVDRWGEPDSSKCILAASIDDRKSGPLLAIARKGGLIEILNPLNGHPCLSISNIIDNGPQPGDDAIVGLHLFKKQNLDLSSRSRTLLTCTTKGNASMRSVELTSSHADSTSSVSSRTWNVCASGNILCSQVDGNENYALFGGKGVEVNVWDLEQDTKIWTAKSPPKNSLGLFTPTWFTSATFLSKDDHRKFVAGTNSHQVISHGKFFFYAQISSKENNILLVPEMQDFWNILRSSFLPLDPNSANVVRKQGSDALHSTLLQRIADVRLYDISAQRRPVISFDFRETPIKAVAEDQDGYTIYIGNGSGDLASVDMRTGKLLGCFLGKCSGSIRSIARHPELPVIASCGLDSYLRFWDIKTRKVLSAVFLKQPLTNVVFDSNFAEEEVPSSVVDPPTEAQNTNETQESDEEEVQPLKRKKKSSKHSGSKKLKPKKRSKRAQDETVDDSS
ncbi:WD repeat-containing protein 74 [Vitis vinifera]|uniref:WD repeat-containing protein 74 n=1 Tax=Vitis vinifera TaxID=29760 RepID=A0A438EQI4_VITVI|nr:WD repeat-containing protein 74 [Vitis vinifera]